MAQAVKNLLAKWETDLIFGWGRSPGEENGNPLQHSSLENYTEKHGGQQWTVVRGVAKSQTQQRNFHM